MLQALCTLLIHRCYSLPRLLRGSVQRQIVWHLLLDLYYRPWSIVCRRGPFTLSLWNAVRKNVYEPGGVAAIKLYLLPAPSVLRGRTRVRQCYAHPFFTFAKPPV